MKKTRNNREASLLPKLQPFFPQEGMASVAVVEDRDRHPKACIKGDIICCVAEQEVARGPITGHYTVVMEDMAEPLFVLWQAQNGAVLNRSARSTAIAFDLSEACVGQLWTSEITVQVTDAVTYDTVVSGTFIQMLVTSDRLLERVAWPTCTGSRLALKEHSSLSSQAPAAMSSISFPIHA